MTRKLWQTGANRLDPVVERFLASDDIQWDQRLVPYDILGNAVQARVLVKAKVLTKAEGARLVRELARLWKVWERGGLKLKLSDEDVHTRIEAELTKRLGALGKKIHTGRSRNDQVLLDIVLYLGDKLRDLKVGTMELAEECRGVAVRHEWIPIPGYTHMQRAMPSSVGLWMGSWAESLFSESHYLDQLHWKLSSPLGSASGYGSLVRVDRNYAARLIGTYSSQNVLEAQTSRGRHELGAMHGIAQILLSCNRLATDCLLFSTAEFGFVSLPPTMTTGSSLMPNKRNADVWELVRSAFHAHLGDMTALASVQANLPSGYNRDLQITKGILMRSVERAEEVLAVMHRTIRAMRVDVRRCREACDALILATDRATLLALKGVPFRDAYRSVKAGGGSASLTLEDSLRRKRSFGAPGNLLLQDSLLPSHIRYDKQKQDEDRRALRRLLDPRWRMGR